MHLRHVRRSNRGKNRKKTAANYSDHYFTAEISEESGSDDELPLPPKPTVADAELPQQYFLLVKIVKYVKMGSPTATLLALCGLTQFDFMCPASQVALDNAEAIDVLINVLEAEDVKCKIASLRVLKQMAAASVRFRRSIVIKSGLPTLVRLLSEPQQDVRSLAAATLAFAVHGHKSRILARKAGAVPLLVDLLDVHGGSGSLDEGKPELKSKLQAATAAAQALWSLSYSAAARRDLYIAGGIPLLTSLTGSPGSDIHTTDGHSTKSKANQPNRQLHSESLNYELLTAVAGIIYQCAADEFFRISVKSEIILAQLLRHMRFGFGKEELQTLCASAVAHFAQEECNRKLLLKLKGSEILVAVLKQSHQLQQQNIHLLKALSLAVWKLSASQDARDRLRQLGIVHLLIKHLHEQAEEVVIPVVSTLSVLATDPESLAILRTEGAIPRLVWLLSGNHPALLSAAALTIANLSAEDESLELLEKLDAARLLWSLLKHPSATVQSGAASAIAAFSERSKSAGEVARSLVGGLELLVSLLRAQELQVITSAAAAVARMASEDETLAVLSDHHVVTLLASLVKSKNSSLKLRVAEAIAQCCRWPGNPAQLGAAGGVKPLITYLKSNNVDLKRAAARALHQVSSYRENCYILHKYGAVPLLLQLVGCGDAVIQSAAAGCLGNIRHYMHEEEH